MANRSFRTRVLDELIISAKQYSKLLGFDFLIESPDFKNRSRYVIRCYEGNFLHLTGVKTKIKPAEFYDRCFNGTIQESDYDCDSSREIKGTVRHKLTNLQTIGSFFERIVVCQETFVKGRIVCLFATSDGTLTLGFTGGNGPLNPHTLLHKNHLDPSRCIRNFSIKRIRRKNKEHTNR